MGPSEVMEIVRIVSYAVGVIREMVDVADKTIEILKKAEAEKRDLTESEIAEVKLRRDAASLRLERALKNLEALSVEKPRT